jgi:hypothetical protein
VPVSSRLKKSLLQAVQKCPGCKVPEILSREAYLRVR